ncbi:MAG: TonB-dependent receptor [Planctomycetes bacterium]|nr:TonB-dependent receptor [Planctomycetota bacterium]
MSSGGAAAGAGTPVVPGGAASSAVNAGDVAGLLQRSTAATGVEVQQRNAVVADPRVRGYHVGQLVTYGDGGFFFPARQDLDTAVSKFDPRSVSSVTVIKGPYSVRYGPGLSFIDIISADTPRYKDGFLVEGRTSYGYQTNGERQSFLQSLQGGDADWGFRLSYDTRFGNDYHAGDGRDVPSSYYSQTVNFALGYNFSEDHKLEFKALRLYQHNVEFAGLFFDIGRLNTEAYSVRYTLNNQPMWDRFNVDAWYNYTGAVGDTHQGAKQAFLNTFLSGPNNFNAPIQDFSKTSFNDASFGYRALMGWGEKDCWQVNVGTDFNYLRNHLSEYIRLLQLAGPNPGIGPATDPLLQQNLGIPQSHLADPGIFVDATLPLTKRLTINGGARQDNVFTTGANRTVTGNILVTPGAVNNPLAAAQVSPIAGPAFLVPAPGATSFDPILFSTKPTTNDLSRHFDTRAAYVTADYKIDEHLTGYVKYGYAERPPTLTELYAAGPFVAVLQQGLNRLVGDPNLKAEKDNQVDAGLFGNYDNVRFGASGFYAFINNYITFDQNKVGPGISQVVFTNTDLATLAGGELFADVDLTGYLTPFLTVSYVQGRDRTHVDTRRPAGLVSSRTFIDTEPLPGISPLEIRSGFRLHEATVRPRWSVEFLARSVLGQNLIAASLSELPTSGFTIFDVRAFWQITDQVLLTGGVENIGDKFYREHLDPRSGDQLFRPGTNAYAAVEVKY